jgi:transcriptional pleiotropic regulator of transition state genes
VTVHREGLQMKSTGIVRKLDDLGRIVLPVEIRRRFGLREGTYVEIEVDGDHIILSRMRELCVFCGRADDLLQFRDRRVCRPCTDELSGAGAL